MINAVIYARYSSHNQTEQSIEGQLHDGYAFAEKNGYKVIHEYIDRALTGTKDARPDFQKMIRDAEKRAFEVVIVWKLDRFARNRYDSAIYKARLRKYGVRVVSVMENITDGPEGIILEGLLESMAEYYSANLAENVRRGLTESVKKGWFPGGGLPLGYRSEGHRLVPDEKTAPLVRELYQRYADGEKLSDIATDFNRRGFRTTRGGLYTVGSFDHTLPNPVYIGEFTYRGQVAPDVAPALVDSEVYERCLQRRAKNRRAPAAGRSKTRYALQGKVFCGPCGSPMIGECGRGRSGEVYTYYKCAARKHGRSACPKKPEKRDFLEWYVCEQTVEYILDPARAALIAARVEEVYNRDTSAAEAERLQKTIDALERELNRLVDRLATVPDAAVQRISDRLGLLEAQKADAETDLAKLRMQQRVRITKKEITAWLRTFARGDLLDPAFRQRIIDCFINSVYLYDDKIVIFFNLRDGQETVRLDPDASPIPDDLTPLDQQKTPNPAGSALSGESGLPPSKVEPAVYFVFVNGVPGIVLPRKR